MTKIRKQKRKKVYRHNVNRKRMRNKQFATVKIGCKQVSDAWDKTRSVKTNLETMGLSYDPNKTIKIPNTKPKPKGDVDEWSEEVIDNKPTASKLFVAEELEREAKAPREKMFRLPKSQVKWITYLMDKYEMDFKAMEKDKRNYYQETWKQLRAKIKRFMAIPAQYSAYVTEKEVGNIKTTKVETKEDSAQD